MKRHCVITGATDGLGLAISRQLLRRNSRVAVVGRTRAKARECANHLRAGLDPADVIPLAADLASPEQVRQLGYDIESRFEEIDLLIHCAGVFCSYRKLSPEGLERTWATNHLAPFRLTHLLFPVLQKSSDARVLVIGSETHRRGNIHLQDMSLQKSYHGIRAYAQSKLANVLFVREFARRCRCSSIRIACVEPGLVKTEIGLKNASRLHRLFWRIQSRRGSSQSPAGAAHSIVELATREGTFRSGLYWSQGYPREPSRRALDDALAGRLWATSLWQAKIQDYFWDERRNDD